ncbi:MAG: hypothetical protein E7045_07145 [Lentisphaerae bacterium]|nr:hypothetical protein [Lentisphaerota bacterium]
MSGLILMVLRVWVSSSTSRLLVSVSPRIGSTSGVPAGLTFDGRSFNVRRVLSSPVSTCGTTFSSAMVYIPFK